MYFRVSVCLFALTLAVPATALRAQSLADLSRKEEERRKAIKTPAKVYTNKDLVSVPALSAPATPTGNSATAGAEAPDPGAGAQPPADAAPAAPTDAKDQAYWSGRGKDLQTQLERDKTFVEALQSRINALTTDFTNRDDPAQRAVIEQDRNKALADLERVNQAIQNDQKAISDFEEEARRAGVPPGWLR